MTEENTTAPSGVSRRTLVKGAAWSLPVIAVAAATPLASASTVAWNATVTAFCTNDYDITALEELVPLPETLALVKAALAGIGITDGATRGFTVTATTGDIPAGTQYLLTDPNALITVEGLGNLVGAGVASVVSTAEGYLITLTSAIANGSSFTVNVYDAIVNVGALSSFTLTQVQADANAGDNSDTTATLLAAAINLGTLGILGVSGSLAVQTCAL